MPGSRVSPSRLWRHLLAAMPWVESRARRVCGMDPHTRRSERADAEASARSVSVLAVGQCLDGLLLVEGGLLGDDALLHRAAVVQGLDDVDELLAEQRRALHDEVDLAVGE